MDLFRLVAPCLVMGLSMPLSTCRGVGAFAPFSNAACPELGSGGALDATYTSKADVNAKVAAFVAAAGSLRELSIEMSATAAAACKEMADDLDVDVPDSDEQTDPGSSVRAACGAVAAEIDEILSAGASARLEVEAKPPKCRANAEAKAQCSGKCEAELTPGQIVAQCEPGKLSGRCEGTCEGRCEGTCRGECDGQCSAKDAKGDCAGSCEGKCQGSCDATCHAHCDGEWKAPRCEADVTPPKASADCEASCKAHASFKAHCEPGKVSVKAKADGERVAKLAATLRANLPALLEAQVGMGKRVLGDVETVVKLGAELPSAVGEAGAQAVACVAAGAQASAEASARIRVSIEASARVSGKVGADL
jgi:hypothetical protein